MDHTQTARLPLTELLEAIGAKTPAPGGGFVASAVGALAASLAGMVVAYSEGKKNLAEHDDLLIRAGAELRSARLLLLQLAAEDAAAYSLSSELSRLPVDDPRRVREYAGAVRAAAQAPLATAAACCDVLRLLEDLAGRTNQWLASDLAIAAILADAGARASRCNVVVNLPALAQIGASEEEIRALLAGLDEMLGQAADRCDRILSACGQRE